MKINIAGLFFVILAMLGLSNGSSGQMIFPAALMEMNKPEYLLKDTLF